MSDERCFIGVDLGGTKTEVIVLDHRNRELFRQRNATPAGDYEATLQNIAQLVAAAEANVMQTDLPVGIGIPGTISRHTRLIKNANSTYLNGQPFKDDMETLLGRHITVNNDANCLAVSEAVDGAGKGHQTVFAAILGTGCGAGIAVNQQVLSGANGIAGEWGHVPMPDISDEQRHNRPCYCGQSGCIETFLSGTGLARTYRDLTGQTATAADIHKRAQQGLPDAMETLQNYRQQLLAALTVIVNILDPDIIVLGGGTSNIQGLYPFINNQLPNTVFGRECDTRVVQSAHGDSSGVRGAAWLNR